MKSADDRLLDKGENRQCPRREQRPDPSFQGMRRRRHPQRKTPQTCDRSTRAQARAGARGRSAAERSNDVRQTYTRLFPKRPEPGPRCNRGPTCLDTSTPPVAVLPSALRRWLRVTCHGLTTGVRDSYKPGGEDEGVNTGQGGKRQEAPP